MSESKKLVSDGTEDRRRTVVPRCFAGRIAKHARMLGSPR
jgi:hypothetical protein